MPELPEVETVCRGLRETILGRMIKRVTVLAPPATTLVSPAFGDTPFTQLLKGRRVIAVDRRGKNILIRLSGHLTLWGHLKMTGHFFWLDPKEPIDKHDLVIFDFTQPHDIVERHHLRFHDYRRFGRLRIFPNDELMAQPALRDLGPEPLEITAEEFVTLCRRGNRMIKPALLDQTFLAGVGNIYADEALYAARIHPMRLTRSIARARLLELHSHLARLLNMAIRLMGTSVDTYSGVNGQAGNFQKYLRAYGREGEACERCGTAVVRRKLGARSAHFCPRCQRAG